MVRSANKSLNTALHYCRLSLHNIFLGFYELLLFERIKRPSTYFRYVDDTFVMVKDEKERQLLEHHLNNLHTSLVFTSEIEKEDQLPFLDVLVKRQNKIYTTCVYRKPTFTGLYTSWNLFCTKKKKINIITTLVHRALMICSKDNLDEEVQTIKKILAQNGYPERLVARIIENKIKSFQNPLPPKGPSKAPVYMKLPYIGNVSEVYRKRIKSAIAKCFGDSVSPRIHLISKPMLKTATKDVLSKTKQSSVLYRFNCSCESSYIGRTSRSLQTRIGEHVPNNVKEKIHKFRTNPIRYLSHSS